MMTNDKFCFQNKSCRNSVIFLSIFILLSAWKDVHAKNTYAPASVEKKLQEQEDSLLGSDSESKIQGPPSETSTAGNGPGNSTPSTESGQGQSLAEAKGAADEGKDQAQKTRNAVREADKNHINEQQKILAVTKKSASQKSKRPDLNPIEKQDALNDQLLVKKAEEAIKKDREFALKQAQLANDTEIRKNLIKISELQKKHKEFQKEETRLTAQIAELGSMAAQMLAKSKGMDTVPQQSGTATPILASQNRDHSSISTGATHENAASKLTTEEQALKALETEIDPTGKIFAGKDLKTKLKLIKDYSLKKALTAKLLAEEKAAAKGNAQATSASSSADKPSAKDLPANQVAAEVLDDASLHAEGGNSFGSSSGHGISLANSETNAEVNRMISALEGQEATNEKSDLTAGILQTDSPTLFERVHGTLDSCLRKRCIISRVNSQ